MAEVKAHVLRKKVLTKVILSNSMSVVRLKTNGKPVVLQVPRDAGAKGSFEY